MTASQKTDNHDPRAKLNLRRYFLEKYHRDGHGRVLDCCMGSGFIWRELQREWKVASYVGLDVKPKKGRLKIDSARYLEAGGWDHDIIDIDTYGAPWKHWVAMLEHMGTSATAFLTIGRGRGESSVMDNASKKAMGIYGMSIPPAIRGELWGLGVMYSLTAVDSYGIEITEALEAESTGNARYIGVRLRRK